MISILLFRGQVNRTDDVALRVVGDILSVIGGKQVTPRGIAVGVGLAVLGEDITVVSTAKLTVSIP